MGEDIGTCRNGRFETVDLTPWFRRWCPFTERDHQIGIPGAGCPPLPAAASHVVYVHCLALSETVPPTLSCGRHLATHPYRAFTILFIYFKCMYWFPTLVSHLFTTPKEFSCFFFSADSDRLIHHHVFFFSLCLYNLSKRKTKIELLLQVVKLLWVNFLTIDIRSIVRMSDRFRLNVIICN